MPSQPEITWNGNTQVMPRFPVKKPTMDIAGGDSTVIVSQSGRSQIFATQGYTKKGVIGFSYILPSSYKSMKSMLSWIKQGRTFSYLSDSSLTKINTTVHSQISSTVIEVTDATNIAATQELYKRTAGWLEEVGTVSSTTGTAFAWTSRTSGTASALYAIAYGAGLFVVVGIGGIVLTSTDGITWTPRTSGTAAALRSIIWSGTQFVAVGDTGTIITSPDGITWTSRTSAWGTASLFAVSYSGTRYVIGGAAVFQYSPDGITWTQVTPTIAHVIVSIIWSGTQFVAVSTSGTIYLSSNGTTWTLQAYTAAAALRSIIWSGTQFVAVGDTGTIITSPDGITWTSRTAPSTNSLTGITWTGRQYIAVSSAGTYATSADGITWAQTALTGAHNAILSTNNLLLIAGNTGEIYTSTIPNRVTFTAALKNTYASGDIVRMEGYYPSVVMIPNSFKEGQKPGIGYHDFEFGIQEVV